MLASVHDVSPLTLEACREAVRLLQDVAGLRASALTVLAIPFHEGRARLDGDSETVRWLREMADGGATVVLHGLTHRMPRPSYNPASWFWGYGFARGQGELYRVDEDDTRRRLDEGREILTAVGLGMAARAFVPPAWLLSPGSARAVAAAGFDWCERLDGIHARGQTRAPRLIGWASLTAIEAAGTAIHAAWQRQRAPADTRVAIHPVDMHRPLSRASITRTLPRLRDRLTPLSYTNYLAD